MLRTFLAVVSAGLSGLVVACIAASPAAAQAPSARSAASTYPSIPITAKTKRGKFTGLFAVTRIGPRRGVLVASGSVTGRLADRRLPSAQTVSIVSFRLPLTVSATPGDTDCARVAFSMTGSKTRMVALPAQFSSVKFTLTPRRGGSPAARDLLCATSRTLLAESPSGSTSAAPAPLSPTLLHLLNALALVNS